MSRNKRVKAKLAKRAEFDKRKRDEAAAVREAADVAAKAPAYKKHLRAGGCDLPFYEGLDSYEAQFHSIVAWAKAAYPTLFGVTVGDPDNSDWPSLGIPADWKQVFFTGEDEMVSSYLTRDGSANMRGSTTAFLDPAGGLHTCIQVSDEKVKDLSFRDRHYGWKLPVLLHEIGHVHDYERGTHFRPAVGEADFVAGEVFAHRYCFEQCYARGFVMVADAMYEGVQRWVGLEGYRGAVAERLFAEYRRPDVKPWHLHPAAKSASPR